MTNKKTKDNIPIKGLKKEYIVLDRIATKAKVKANKTDDGGNFYIYDLYEENGNLLALNRYVYKDAVEQPFDKLTTEEELILNPPPDPEEPMHGMI